MTAYPGIRRHCLWLLLALALPAQAANSAAELQTLQNNAYRASTQMMMYVILDHASDRKATAAARLSTGDAAASRLGDTALSQKWQEVRAAVIKNPYSDGEVNPYAIYDMESRATELAAEIRARMPPDLPRHQKALYELVGILQAMTTIYLRNNADPRGGSGYVGINFEVDLAVLKQEFNLKMQNLAKADAKLAKALAKTQAKWSFLADRFTDYNRQTVPYIVDLYGHQIIDELMVLAAAQR